MFITVELAGCDWRRLHEAGIGHWVESAPIGTDAGLGPGDAGDAVLAVQADLAAYGYDVPQTGRLDGATELTVAAFQRHFRPARVDGRADRSTRTTLARLIAALENGTRHWTRASETPR